LVIRKWGEITGMGRIEKNILPIALSPHVLITGAMLESPGYLIALSYL
jgi:hypothetical protein